VEKARLDEHVHSTVTPQTRNGSSREPSSSIRSIEGNGISTAGRDMYSKSRQQVTFVAPLGNQQLDRNKSFVDGARRESIFINSSKKGDDALDEETVPVPMGQFAAKVHHEKQSSNMPSQSAEVRTSTKPAPVIIDGQCPRTDAARAGTPVPSAGGDRVQKVSATMAPPPPEMSKTHASTTGSRKVVEDDGMIVVRGIKYTKLECVGKGGSSKVYKVMAPNKKIFALKRIRLNGRDEEAASGFLDEITLLTRLLGKSNIIQLIDSEVHRRDGIIYMVLECGDIDLARLLQRHEAARQERRTAQGAKTTGSAIEVDENFVRMYWEQMLHAVDTIHRERIVHSDLKPANFLMVEGQLKLIDFGIAKAIQAGNAGYNVLPW